MNQNIEKLINIAMNEVGYLEKNSEALIDTKTGNAGTRNFTKYGRDMHKIEPRVMDYPAPWCDAFVDWCHVMAFGVDTAKKLLHAFDDYTVQSAQYFKNAKEWFTDAKVGDQVFFWNSAKTEICHTGIVYAVDSSRIYTVEGNTSGASGVIDNGGGVAKKSYLKNYARIAGFGRPNYAIIKNESEVLTMTQYEELKKLIETLTTKVDAIAKENDRQNGVIQMVGDDIEALKKGHEKQNEILYNVRTKVGV